MREDREAATTRTGVPEAVLREAVRRAAGATSVRRVAREADLAPRTLDLFLNEPRRSPRARTLVNLRNWYVRTARTREVPTATDAEAAFEVLLDGLPAEHRARVLSDVLRLLRAWYRQERSPPPAWLNGYGERGGP